MYLDKKKDLNSKMDSTIKKLIAQNNKLSSNYCSEIINEYYKPLGTRISKNVFNSKNYNDINFEYSEILKKYDTNGKGSLKDEIGFDNIKNKEEGIINVLKEIIKKEGEKNIKKMERNIKLAQVDLDDINNKKRVLDEKEKINNNKIQNLENENNELNEEIVELKENLNKKKEILNNLKKRIEQMIKNKKKLEEMNKENETKNDSEDDKKKKRKKNDVSCQCNLF